MAAFRPMARNRPQPKVRDCVRQPGLGRMLLLSFGLHLAVILIFAVGILPEARRPPRPVYYIDLTNLPVRDPQAGRPDARPESAKKAEVPPASRPEPPKPASPQPKPTPPKEEPKPVKPAPAPARPEAAKPSKKEAPKTETTGRKTADEKALAEKLRQMQARQEMEELKRKLEQMGSLSPRPGAADVPVGMPTGKGAQAGVDEQEWISAFIKQNWNLSKYQIKSRDAWVRTRLIFDPRGALLDYKFLRESGDATFDDSVKRAILKARQLPFQPERRLEIEVEFNLKDME